MKTMYVRVTICGTQSLKYVPSGTLQKKFAEHCLVLFQNILLADAVMAPVTFSLYLSNCWHM